MPRPMIYDLMLLVTLLLWLLCAGAYAEIFRRWFKFTVPASRIAGVILWVVVMVLLITTMRRIAVNW